MHEFQTTKLILIGLISHEISENTLIGRNHSKNSNFTEGERDRPGAEQN